MSKSKIFAMMALIVFAMAIVLVGNVAAGESGKITMREVHYCPTAHVVKVPDVEGHIIVAYEGKGIAFYEKWGVCLAIEIGTFDILKGEGSGQGYSHYTFPDGSTITGKWEGKIGGGGATAEGTWTNIKGTGKFQGIQGEGTWKSYNINPGIQWYADSEITYTLP
jgi:hypothetical protein